MVRSRETQNQSSITIADHLARAVDFNLLPQDRQTYVAYGFTRAVSPDEKRRLLGLYTGLIKDLNISPKTIDEWRVRGVLVDEIKAAFYRIPKASRVPYIPWFLQNQRIVALADQPLSDEELRALDDAVWIWPWRFTGGSERDSAEEISTAIAGKSPDEQMCFMLYTFILFGRPPSSSMNAWINFGFASCTSEEEENTLLAQYQRLINTCTFKEFCDGYHNHCLLDLFHSKGLQVDDNAQLRDLLAADTPAEWKKTVWVLKMMVAHPQSTSKQSATLYPQVIRDYGLVNCRSKQELRELLEVYRDFFTIHHGDSLALHKACVNGNLYDFLSNAMPGLHPKYQRLLEKQQWRSYYTGWGTWCFTWILVLLVAGVMLGGILIAFFFVAIAFVVIFVVLLCSAFVASTR